jgi:drug/metabolite transporter (DMT)-like permease
VKGVTLAILSCACFGFAPIFEKTLLTYMTPSALAALRSITAGLILYFVMEAFNKIKEIDELTRRDILLLITITGMVGIFGPLFYLKGLKTTSVANTLILARFNSFLIAVFAGFLLKERWSLHQLFGSIFMISGLLIIFTRGFTIGYSFLPGDIYILTAALFWSSSTVFMKKYLCHLPPELLVVSRNIIGGCVLFIFAYQDITSIVPVFEIPLFLAGLAIFGVILSQMLWYTALEHTDATNVGLISITIPIFGTFFAAVLLKEILVTYQLIGGFFALLGLAAMEVHLSKTTIHKLECALKTHFHFHH